MSITSPNQTRAALFARLQDRRSEIEAAVLTRVHAVSEPAEGTDPNYLQGLREAVSAAVAYGLAIVEHGEERVPPIPDALLSQARLAARNWVPLDTVLRRYCAGQALLGDFIVEEAENAQLAGGALQRLLRAQATLFDRLLEAVSEEHARAAPRLPASAQERRAERIRRLLAGEMVDASELDYDLGGCHLGLVAQGAETSRALRDLAAALDRRLLSIPAGEETTWAWLGGRRAIDLAELKDFVTTGWPVSVSLALGEPGEGIAGWRLSHRQARATLPIALRRPEPMVRYADVALLASILQDDLLVTSLRELYLAPLESGRDRGKALRETLRAYFAAERNVSSASAALGVSRQTVINRLRSIESLLGRNLSGCAGEIEVALRLKELGDTGAPLETSFPKH